MSDVSGYLMVSAKSSCRDITCESVPGSLPPFIFFVGARGEPGNEAKIIYLLPEVACGLWEEVYYLWSYL